MRVHQIDPSGFYIGSIEADPDPMVPGQFLIPAGAVTEPLIDWKEGERLQWDHGWKVVPVNTSPTGPAKPEDAPIAEDREAFPEPEPVEEPETPETPEPELTLSERVTAELDRRFVAGCMVRFSETKQVHVTGDDKTARNVSNLASVAGIRIRRGDSQSITRYRDTFNNYWQLTQSEVEELYLYSVQYGSDLYAASWAIKDMVPVPEDIRDDALWPSVEVGRPVDLTPPPPVDPYDPPVPENEQEG